MTFKKNYVLIVDDDKNDFLHMARKFREYDIIAYHTISADEMIKKLPEIEQKLTAIILDIKGKKSLTQEIENPDFITHVIKLLDTNKKYQKIKKFIASGSPDDFEKYKSFNTGIEAFTKNLDDLDILAKKIVEHGNTLENVTIRNEYGDVFKAITRLKLGTDREKNLQEVLINRNTTDTREIINYLGILRRINEHIYKQIAQYIPEISDKSRFMGEGGIDKVLNGNRYFSPNRGKVTNKYYYKDIAIERAVNTIHWIGSMHGAHDGESLELTGKDVDSENFPTNYTLKTVLYSLLDIILWYDRFVQKSKGEK